MAIICSYIREETIIIGHNQLVIVSGRNFFPLEAT